MLETSSKVWDTDKLLCAFDGMSITLPCQKDLKWSPWPHCDQSLQRKGMQCVQGLPNYQPNGPGDGGLILMKGNSKLYDEFFHERREQDDHEDKPPGEEDFRNLLIFRGEEDKWFQDRDCTLEKVNLEPGGLVFWYILPTLSLTSAYANFKQRLSHHALRLIPSRRPYSPCSVCLRDTREVCEARGLQA